MKREDGYTSVGVLLLVLFLSASVIGILAYSRIMGNQHRRIENLNSVQLELETVVYDLMDQLAADPTPQSDSPHDPVWQYITNREEESLQIELRDISSRFNLNFMRTKMLDESEFASMMIDGKTPDDLKSHRGEEGFSDNLAEGYSSFFDKEDLERFFTVYSYANINVTYEDSLKKLYESRVSEEGSHLFLTKVQELISDQLMADEARMNNMLGGDRGKLYPLINLEPLINVNFAEEKVLKAVLSYPYGGETHNNALDYHEILRAERTAMEITPERLKTLFDVEDHYMRIPQYLGTVTWFWEIRASRGNTGLNVIICRIPGREAGEGLFQIVEWKLNS